MDRFVVLIKKIDEKYSSTFSGIGLKTILKKNFKCLKVLCLAIVEGALAKSEINFKFFD